MTKAEAYWILDELRKERLSELYGEACGIAQECIEFADLMQERTQTKTNADRIRAMSDEELVKMIISSEEEFWLLCMLENRRRGNAT